MNYIDQGESDNMQKFVRPLIDCKIAICLGVSTGVPCLKDTQIRSRIQRHRPSQILKGQMLNVGCEKVNVHLTELEGRIRKLYYCL